ncbi:hypothetical protein Q5752_005992 [Cryptotrichosporon argae]
MPKIYASTITYDFAPAHTVARLLRKYPNPFATHVFSVDTVAREVDPATGVVRSERVIGVQQGAPKWITKLFSLPDTAYVREVVFIDPNEPSATCMSMNLSLAQYVSCLELIHYKSDPSSPQRTLFDQRALMVSAFPTKMIARRIEKASADRFAANAGVGRKGFEWVLMQ